MDKEDQKSMHRALHHMVQRFRMPTVLYILARIAQHKSLDLRDERDVLKGDQDRHIVRNHASKWEDACKDLRRLATKLKRIDSGT